jgi:mannan endo-1,4-beta-mannosidase
MKKSYLYRYLVGFCIFTLALLTSSAVYAQTVDLPGFRVQGRHLYDRFGNKVVLVGINKMVIWTDRDGIPSFPEIAKTGANVVRIVWLTEGSAEELDIAITNAINNKLIPMVDCHDSTGKWELLPKCVDYWVRPDIIEILKKHEQYLLINIANEAGEGIVPEWAFRAAYELAINRMRQAGLHVPLIIDAQGYGQSIDDLQKNGPYLIDADPDHNLMFSIHMWWPTAWRGTGVKQYVINEIAQSVEMELPLIVGEFANKGPGCSCCIPYETIIEQCHINEVGYLPWSWGPGNSDCAEMDMTEDGFFDTLHGWGLEVAITSTHSIKAIAVRPDWIVNATPIPIPTPVPAPTPQPAPTGLISQGKPVRVSSSENDSLSGDAAVDGLLNTRWSSAWSDPQDIVIDLEENMEIGRIVLEWETAYGKEYFLQVSDDGESWTDVIHETSSDGGQDNFMISANGRYVRLNGIKRATEWGYSLYEFWVFDSADAPLPDVSAMQEVINKPDLRPDLVITSLSFSPETMSPGTDVTLQAVVANQGRAAALGRFHITFTIAGNVIGEGISERPLAPEDSITIGAKQTWKPDNTGGFVMLASVDDEGNMPYGIVDEQDENNNLQSIYSIVKTEVVKSLEATKTTALTIEPSPTPEPDTPTPEPTVGKYPVKPSPDYRWVWGGLILILVVIALVFSYLTLKRK